MLDSGSAFGRLQHQRLGIHYRILPGGGMALTGCLAAPLALLSILIARTNYAIWPAGVDQGRLTNRSARYVIPGGPQDEIGLADNKRDQGRARQGLVMARL
jgi:hypothetical protein